MSKERPILFSGPMVRALLDGRKTQTRRVVKSQPPMDCGFIETAFYNPIVIDRNGDEQPGPEMFGAYSEDGSWGCKCPYGAPGDRLWVRESTRSRFLSNFLTGEPTQALCGEYTADYAPILDANGFDFSWWYSRSSCPSIHMPRWASRITLEVTGARVERLQDISETDAEAEGVEFLRHVPDADETLSPRDLFRCLWDGINGNGVWDANPWVWVVEFKRI